MPEQVLNIGEYHFGHYSISKGDSISDAGNVIIQMVIDLTPMLLTMCRKSTPWYNKAPYQATYDSCYGLHGSNGTYVENANPEWVLKFRLRRLDFAVNESVSNQINIHQYITQN